MAKIKTIAWGFSVVTLTALIVKTDPVSAGYKGNLEVEFKGINSSKGQICMNLFNGQRGFPEGGKGASLVTARCTPIVKGNAQMKFANLPYGSYAIAVVHDTNGDTRMNSNFLGIPTEGIGFSNNPIVQNAAPSFSEAQFFVSGSRTDLSIKMQYFN